MNIMNIICQSTRKLEEIFVFFSPSSRKAKWFLDDDQGQDKLRVFSLPFLNIDRLLTNKRFENFPLIARIVVALKLCQLNSNCLVLCLPS